MVHAEHVESSVGRNGEVQSMVEMTPCSPAYRSARKSVSDRRFPSIGYTLICMGYGVVRVGLYKYSITYT